MEQSEFIKGTEYPLNTFSEETRKELIALLESKLQEITEKWYSENLYTERMLQTKLEEYKAKVIEAMPEERDMVGDNLECNCDGGNYCNCDFSRNDGFNEAREQALNNISKI